MIDGAPYRSVRVTVWHDEKFFHLSDDGQLVWFHLYTNPMSNGLGMYFAPIEGLAANKRWDLERYRKGFGEGLSKGLFEYDETFQVVYFPKFLKHNSPANPNVMVSLLKQWDVIPPTPLKARLYADLKGLGEPYAKRLEKLNLTLPQTFSHTLSDQYPKQEQEQEQDTEQDKTKFVVSNSQPDSPPEASPDQPEKPDKPKRFVAAHMELPPEVDPATWVEWCEFRSSKRKPISERAASQQLKLLAKYPQTVQAEMVNQSITNDYQGLFEPKGGSSGISSQPKSTPAERMRAELAEYERSRGVDAQAVDHPDGNVRTALDVLDGGDPQRNVG